jgi:hypothetical protein
MKKTYTKPILTSFGNLDHINDRVTALQRLISFYQEKANENPTSENTGALEAYNQELSRIQKKYKLFLKQNAYAS